MAHGQAPGIVFDIFCIQGGIVGAVGDQHGDLNNVIEPAARLFQKPGDEGQGVSHFFGWRLAPMNALRRIMRRRMTRDLDHPPARTTRVNARGEPGSGS